MIDQAEALRRAEEIVYGYDDNPYTAMVMDLAAAILQAAEERREECVKELLANACPTPCYHDSCVGFRGAAGVIRAMGEGAEMSERISDERLASLCIITGSSPMSTPGPFGMGWLTVREMARELAATRVEIERLQQANRMARDLVEQATAEIERLKSEELPEIPCCPVHENLLKAGNLKPFDNCIACIRNERDELRAELDTAIRTRNLAQEASTRDLEAKRAAEAELARIVTAIERAGPRMPRRPDTPLHEWLADVLNCLK